MNDMTPKSVIERYRRAKDRRVAWESHWQECYDYAMPQREAGTQLHEAGGKRTDKIFDSTAPDAVDQLAASLLAHLTPPWARWFGFTAGPQASDLDLVAFGADMEAATTLMQSHFDRSNFAVELHQCYLDLVTAGSACLLFEEADAVN